MGTLLLLAGESRVQKALAIARAALAHEELVLRLRGVELHE
jgi:hypothetical protein